MLLSIAASSEDHLELVSYAFVLTYSLGLVAAALDATDPSQVLRGADQLGIAVGADVPDIVNPKDRHIVRAAIPGEAVVLVTEDGRLRKEIASSEFSIEAVAGDAFAIRLWDAFPTSWTTSRGT